MVIRCIRWCRADWAEFFACFVMKLVTRIGAGELSDALHVMAQRVLARFGEAEPVMVLALLNGATWFAADLLRLLPLNYRLETVRVGSYGAGFESSGALQWLSCLPECAGARVLVLDEVLESGITLHSVVEALRAQGAAEVATAVVVDKEVPRRVVFSADFVAFRLGEAYLVGYGMDAAGVYRNLPYIAEVVES